MLTVLRFIASLIICLVALLLPYQIRITYFKLVSEAVHLPFKLFGRLAQWLLKELQVRNPYE